MATYTLRGYLLASSEKGGSKISYIWDVTDAKGTRVARVSGDELVPGRTADPWDNVNGTVLNIDRRQDHLAARREPAARPCHAGRCRVGRKPCRDRLCGADRRAAAAGERRASSLPYPALPATGSALSPRP